MKLNESFGESRGGSSQECRGGACSSASRSGESKVGGGRSENWSSNDSNDAEGDSGGWSDASDGCEYCDGTVRQIGSEEEFERISTSGPALIEFFAKWCGPCRATAPILKRLAAQFAGKAAVGQVDVDQTQSLASRYSVAAIPTMLVFDDGEVVERFTGLQSESTLENALDSVLATPAT